MIKLFSTRFLHRLVLVVIILSIISLFSQTVLSAKITKKNTIEIENEALKLSKVWRAEEIRRSISLFNQASANWERLGELNKASFCLQESAKLSFIISDQKNALTYLKKALKFNFKTKNLEDQVITNSLLFQAYKFNSQSFKGLKFLDQALKLSESSTFKSKTFSHFTAGEYHLNNGNQKIALELLLKALTYSEKTDDKILQAHILLNLGIANAMDDNKVDALNKIEEAKSLWENENYQRGKVLTYNTLGFVYVITNEKQKGLDYYQKVLKLIPDDFDLTQKALANVGLGSVYQFYGLNEITAKFYYSALRNLEKANYEEGQLITLNSLARILYYNDEQKESSKLLDKALILSQKLNNDFLLAYTQETIGLINLDQGFYNQALENFKKAQIVYSKVGIKLPTFLNSLGKTNEKLSNLQLAKNYYNLALKVSRKSEDLLREAETLHNLANLHNDNNEINKALQYSSKSILITESIYYIVNNNNMRESFFSSTFDRYDLYINLLMKMHERFPEKGFDIKALKASEKSRARQMSENLQLSANDITVDANPILIKEEIEISNKLLSKKQELTNLLGNNAAQDDIEKLRMEILILEDQHQIIIADLKKESPIYSAIKYDNDFDLEGFQKRILDENTITLEFFFGKDKSYLWLISKSETKVFTLPKCQILESKIDNLRKLLNFRPNNMQESIESNQKKLIENEIEYWKEAKDLSQMLFGQVSELIKGKRLIIIPDGRLNYFPISALPIPNDESNTTFLHKNEIVYEPSASMLYLLKTNQKTNNLPQEDFLIYSDAVFSSNDPRLTDVNKNQLTESKLNVDSPLLADEKSLNTLDSLERLPASAYEVESIFNYFDSTNSTLKSGFDANRNDLVNRSLSDYKVLHFATHGFFNEEIPELSGIVLSRFNKQGYKQTNLVWLQDIYKLRLAADLIVLSACDTGNGKEIKGEGLMSLTNGFLQVGAKSVMSSHWKVEDNATQELFKLYYEILANENVTSSKALQMAKIELSKNPNYKFPYYWASFTIHGDFENRPNLSKKSNYTNYLLIVLLSIVLVGIYCFINYKKPKII